MDSEGLQEDAPEEAALPTVPPSRRRNAPDAPPDGLRTVRGCSPRRERAGDAGRAVRGRGPHGEWIAAPKAAHGCPPAGVHRRG